MLGFLGRMNARFPLVIALALVVSQSTGRSEEKLSKQMETLIPFDGKAGEPKWKAVNDGVMGGLSEGGPDIKDGSLRFTGILSLENNGGFSSVRTVRTEYDFSGNKALVMRVKGDGRSYQLRLSTDARHRGSLIAYGAEFPTEEGKWIVVRVPFESLSPTWRGDKLDGPPLDLSKVEEIGILIGDKKPGAFTIKLDWIGVE